MEKNVGGVAALKKKKEKGGLCIGGMTLVKIISNFHKVEKKNYNI